MADFTVSGKMILTADEQMVMQQMAKMTNALQTQMVKAMAGTGAAIDNGLTKPLKQSHIAASKTYGYMKDIGRIVQGIFISQILYRGILQPIQNAVKELWNFNMELERTELSFKYLLKATEDLVEGTEGIADALMKTLKIIAAQTPFIMSTVTSATQTLMALGFKEAQLKPLLVLMADLAAATGGASDQMSRLAEALGKVQQRGRMTMREFRLFVSAKVPIMDILEKELGYEGLPKMMAIPAGTILPAILRYIMRFKGAAADMEQSMTGLLSSIHDYFLFISNDIFKGFFDAIKERLSSLRLRLADLWEVFAEFGLEGLIADVFPPEIALAVWQLIHLLQELGRTIGNALEATAPFRQELIKLVLIVNNWLNTGFLIFGKVIEYVTRGAAKLSIITKILASALIGLAISSTVSMSLTLLAKSFGFVSVAARIAFRNVGLVVGALTALALMIPRVRNWFTNLGNSILKSFGIEIPQSIMAVKKAIAGTDDLGDIDWQQFIDAFSGVEEGAEGAATAINDKFLASFDEVYEIPEKASTAGLAAALGDLSDLGDFDFSMDEPDLGLEDIKEALEDFIITWKDVWEIIKIVGKGIWDSIKLIFGKIREVLPSLGWAILETIYKIFYHFPSAIAETLALVVPKMATIAYLIITALFKALSVYGLDRLAMLTILIAGMLLKIGVSWAMIGNAIGMMIAEAIITGLFDNLITMINRKSFDTIRNLAHGLLEPLEEMGFEWAGTMLDAYDEWEDKQVKVLDNAAKNVMGWAKENSTAYDEAQKTIETSLGDIVETTKDMTGLIFSESTTFYNDTLPIWEQLGKDIVGTLEGTPEEIKKIWEPGLSDISDTWVTWWDKDGKPVFEGTGVELLAIFEKMGIDISGVISNELDKIPDIVADKEPSIGESFMLAMGGGAVTGLDKASANTKKAAEDFGRRMGEEVTGGVSVALNTFEEESDNEAIIGNEWWNEKIEAVQEAIGDWSIWNPEWWIGQWKKIQDWGIWDWFKGIENWTVWTWFTDIGNWNIWDPEWWIGIWKKIEKWTDLWSFIKGIEFWPIWDWFENKLGAFDVWKAEFMQSFVDTIATIWGSLLGRIAPPINAVLGFIEESVNSMIGGLNRVIELINEIPVIGNLIDKILEIAIPKITLDTSTGPSQPAGTGSSPSRPKKFGYGAIVTRPTMAEVGESGDTEGVFPLNKTSMKPFADMIGGLINGGNNSPNVAADYVLVPVNKRDLERELYTIRLAEAKRSG